MEGTSGGGGGGINPLSLSSSARNTAVTVGTNFVVLVSFISGYFSNAPSGYIITSAVVYAAHVMVVWIDYLAVLIGLGRRGRMQQRFSVSPLTAVVQHIALFFMASILYTVLYASLILFDANAFAPRMDPTTTSRLSRLFLSLFISVDNMTVLGAGTITPGVSAGPGAYVLYSLNSIQGSIFWIVVMSRLLLRR